MITFWMFESDGIKNLLFVESMTSSLLKSPCLECKIYDLNNLRFCVNSKSI